MNVIFEDNNISSEIKKTVKNIISRNGKKSGNILVEYLPEDSLECYEDDENFIANHQDSCEIYMVYQNVGTWNQPLTMVAVAE